MSRAAERHRGDPSNERLSPDQGGGSPDLRAGGGSSCANTLAGAARCFHHSAYPASRLAGALRARRLSVSVCLPARECADTVGEIVAALGGLREAGVLDQIVVVDAQSRDGTAAIAARAGAILVAGILRLVLSP